MFKKRAITFLIILVGGWLILSLCRNIFQLLRSEKKVYEAKEEVEQLEEEKKALLKRKEEVESEAFVEEQARNKLNMSKEGEVVMIVSPEVGKNLVVKKEEAREIPNWQKWLAVFGW